MATARRRRMGDRREGRLLRSLPGYSKFIPFIMPQKNDRFIHYEESFEVTELDRMLRMYAGSPCCRVSTASLPDDASTHATTSRLS